MIKWYREIRKVGFANWFWFVFFLRRNEFSDKLNVDNYTNDNVGMTLMRDDRERAHKVDNDLSELALEIELRKKEKRC